jgi:hypothetical protein
MPPRKKKTPSARGDCYEAAGQFLFEQCLPNPDCGLVLVHGEVAGQGPLEGVTFGHAWVLDGETVIDKSNGRNLRLPKVLYYALGGIERIGNLYAYTWQEAKEKMLQFKHYGPWDLKTRSGL